METQPGKPLNVEDRLLGNAEVIGALAKACALPRDMETHERFDNESLMVSAIQASLLVSVCNTFLHSSSVLVEPDLLFPFAERAEAHGRDGKE